jgi:hypothetical protein
MRWRATFRATGRLTAVQLLWQRIAPSGVWWMSSMKPRTPSFSCCTMPRVWFFARLTNGGANPPSTPFAYALWAVRNVISSSRGSAGIGSVRAVTGVRYHRVSPLRPKNSH